MGFFKNKNKECKTSFEQNENNNIEEIFSPVKGELIKLSEVEDEAFSQELIGKGIAINPSEGKVYSPSDGVVVMTFVTKHAIALISDKGCEILIHLGMDTVKLKGKYFNLKVKDSQKVKKGDLLFTFDIEGIISEGYSIKTPIVVTNFTDYKEFILEDCKSVNVGDKIITLKR